MTDDGNGIKVSKDPEAQKPWSKEVRVNKEG